MEQEFESEQEFSLKKFFFGKISNKISFGIILIVIILAGVGMSISYLEQKAMLEHEIINHLESIRITKRNFASGRATELVLDTSEGKKYIGANKFRMHIGPNVIRSTLFAVENKRDKIRFYGRGWGHGVGFCQWGAKGMSERKYSYKSILKHYYNNIKIEKWEYQYNRIFY